MQIDIDAIRRALRTRYQPRQKHSQYRSEWYDRYSRQWIAHRRYQSQKRAIWAAQSFCEILLHDVPYRVINVQTGLPVWERTE